MYGGDQKGLGFLSLCFLRYLTLWQLWLLLRWSCPFFLSGLSFWSPAGLWSVPDRSLVRGSLSRVALSSCATCTFFLIVFLRFFLLRSRASFRTQQLVSGVGLMVEGGWYLSDCAVPPPHLDPRGKKKSRVFIWIGSGPFFVINAHCTTSERFVWFSPLLLCSCLEASGLQRARGDFPRRRSRLGPVGPVVFCVEGDGGWLVSLCFIVNFRPTYKHRAGQLFPS